MNNNNTCIWALLSIGQLEFVNASLYDDKLIGQSLFDLIHPGEVLLAKRDLNKFMKSDVLGGSVTRCRLKDYTTTTHCSPLWIVVDIIMYVATKNLVLAFFHLQQDFNTSICGDHNFCASSLKKNRLFQQLSYNASSSPHQIFHILDNQTKSVLLSSWPDHYPNEIINAQMNLLEDRPPMSPGISCFHCVQKPIQTTLLGQKIHSLIIEYGSISFVLIQIKKKSNLILSPSISLPSSPTTYYNKERYVTTDQQRSPCSTSLLEYSSNTIRRTSAPSSPIRNHFSTTTTTTTTTKSMIKLEDLLLPPTINNKQEPHQRNHCQSCGTDSSPEWRRGPTGHKTLCNACGLRYSRSVARQSKIANQKQQQQQQQQQHYMFQSQNTPHHQPYSPPSSSSSSCSSPLISSPSSFSRNMDNNTYYNVNTTSTTNTNQHYNSSNSNKHHKQQQ